MTESPSVGEGRPPRRLACFQVTRQHRQFVEFADAVRGHRYIGACYGAPGLGDREQQQSCDFVPLVYPGSSNNALNSA